MKRLINYHKYGRQEWAQFHGEYRHNIAAADLQQLKSVGDQISLEDVQEIYAPLRHLLHLYLNNYQQLSNAKARFLGQKPHQVPFIIGISGSVAVGKSTTARLLKMMLQRAYPQYKIEQITTDGFLYPNAELAARHLTADKGFPWSYDNEKLLRFLEDVKADQGPVTYPVYSHQINDVLPDQQEQIEHPDILIMEGINVLQLPQNQQIYVSDYFDFAIYVDADPQLIEQWYLHRFQGFLAWQRAHPDPTNFYYQFLEQPEDQVLVFAHRVWQETNYRNLLEYIAPTMQRADLILHKTTNHFIDKVYLRKY
ncbi:type I pantothenate kinase [Lactobacillus sp. DCY120]|uniref:Pantothenate kinase n=1 Tax=Bombilactobacillus apium TaxID=2675299 RepID=A0A850R6A0_9LACO|nr:type I pantothenate kinase [Bombilactobacillus apium]NVY96162.1 type I pantothenate kinase [Bombilactobacillus apium]